MRRVKKSRNGCARCKSKRVKCGEEKPHCNRCTRLGVHCPGYVQSLRWVSQPVNPSPTASLEGGKVYDDLQLASSNHMGTSELELDSLAAFDNLWFVPVDDTLPELMDLHPPSPPGLSNCQDPVNDFAPGNTEPDISGLLSLLGPFEEENHGSIYRHFSPSAIVRSYHPPGQRTLPPAFMSISRPLNNSSWTLIEYYFKEVAALFSSYDSQMNPFRTTVSRLWGSSRTMFLTMQSMAAASLVNEFPQFGLMGQNLRHQAVDLISSEAVMDDKALLAILMLGQTASWHDPKDLGISFFNILRKQLNTNPTPGSSGIGFIKNSSNNYRFFDEALVYWEMLLSFVADNEKMTTSDHSNVSSSELLALQCVPHPWTGIARDTQLTVNEVGKLVRRERKRILATKFTSRNEINRDQMTIDKAYELEERLLALAHPNETEIVSPGDDDTPVWHLLTMAEVYRCTGLIQLYRVFPDLLRSRLSPYDVHFDTAHLASLSPLLHNLDSRNVSTRTDNQTPGNPSNENWTPTHRISPSPPKSSPSIDIFSPSFQNHHYQAFTSTPKDSDPVNIYDSWLTELAVTTLSRLKTLPFESRTRCLQPLLLVASCSELRLTPPSQTSAPYNSPNGQIPSGQLEGDDNPSTGTGPETEASCISMEAIEVSNTRKFILGRLTSLLHVLPPRPVQVCLKLVEEVWRRMDAGETDIFWIDVMIENGWETTMG
ncbi:transcriptional regulator family: Fungal Specific TF [Penicillium taxi]|uniref:transcriptional regulator family: Fungal Specific TF n=1 Tax=Penicillium taxi TaxID=168475 RepID=UPI002544D42E|nr:transcriptional regulator family: Fungal Specific TF [Penicillium taxi]KAJ5895254.1 transcriptional regulator family: Fungal Specific TF [Penicillium taxi]